MMTNLKKSPKIASQELEEKIIELEKIMDSHEKIEKVMPTFEKWRIDVKRTLDGIFLEPSKSKGFLIETKVLLNKFSNADNATKIGEALGKGKRFLNDVTLEVTSGIYSFEEKKIDSIDKSTAVIIIRRILMNFYKHISSMYQDEVHGNGKIKKEDLDKIKVGNEYDVQRIYILSSSRYFLKLGWSQQMMPVTNRLGMILCWMIMTL